MNQGNNNFDTNIDLVLSMFNQYLYQDCKNNIDDIQYYYMTNPNTMGNNLIDQLLGAIKQYPLESIGLPLFQSILSRSGKTQAEMNNIMERLIEYKQYSREQIEPARGFVKDLIASVYVSRAQKLYSKSPAEFINYFKNLNFKSSNTDYLNSVSFDQVDINSIVAEQGQAEITSSFGFINDSFTEGAYKPGDIIVVSAPPSVGKSLIAETEALHFAIKHNAHVNLLVMGDLDMSSLMLRLAAIYTGLPFREARRHLPEIYKELRKVLGNKLDVIIAPAGCIKAADYVQYILNSPKKYKACFVDYDENFAVNYSGDNGGGMYAEFSDIYNEFTKLKEKGIITEILCQPKVHTWTSDDETIELCDLGTSSRKGHIADVCITVKKLKDNMNGLCIFNIAKNRHGYNDKAYSIRLNNGRFKIIPRSVFNDIKQVSEHKDYTEADIDSMVGNYINNRNVVQQQLSQKMQQPRGANPFN